MDPINDYHLLRLYFLFQGDINLFILFKILRNLNQKGLSHFIHI
jgi:hypothetical protein